MMRTLTSSLAIAAFLAATPALAASVKTQLSMATPQGPGAPIGTATIKDSPKGAVIVVDLKGLQPGERGMHIHEKPSCDVGPGPDGKPIPAGAAGPHWDPGSTMHHLGPEGAGHMGDLPRLTVGPDGSVKTSLVAPRIKDVSMLRGHTLMVHVGGDNYTDTPPLGGGGARFACGVLN